MVLRSTVRSKGAYLADSNGDTQLRPQDEKWTGDNGSNQLTLVVLVNDKCACETIECRFKNEAATSSATDIAKENEACIERVLGYTGRVWTVSGVPAGQ